MSRQAKINAFFRVSETCPAVERDIRNAIGSSRVDAELSSEDLNTLATDAFDAARTAGTEPLREALIACEEELLTAKSERDDMETERDAAKSEADDLREQVSELAKKLEEAEAHAADSSLSDGK